MNPEGPRLIEVAFPLKQASLDSVHEKNVRHGHISTLHIWPARRPLAACRAALIATLLPDPGNAEERKELLEKIGGKVVEVVKKKKLPGGEVEEVVTEETRGGILHWGRESGPDLEWFRAKIREAYGGRAPRVLDPFAGGGAIPLEAMRLGCEVTAIDINPVAWFILKCTLEYPQRLAGQRRPLPSFALQDREFTGAFFKAQGLNGAALRAQMDRLGLGDSQQRELSGLESSTVSPEADLAWHVRAWGSWVLQRARADLERFYPTVDGKPTVAYLWARTVKCKNCRATIPLLKTKWLCKKEKKRVALTITPDLTPQTPSPPVERGQGVRFGIIQDVPQGSGSAAQRREYDKRVGAGTMSRSGATCPCCGAIMTMEDIRLEGRAGRLGTVMTAVVVEGPKGKEYRLPTPEELSAAEEAAYVEEVFQEIPFGLPTEPLPTKEALGFRVPLYGFDQWYKLFTPRQLVGLGTFVKHTRAAREAMRAEGYPEEWVEAVAGYLSACFSRLADYSSTICIWALSEFLCHTFTRFALPITWDFVEGNPIGATSGNFEGALGWVTRVCEHLQIAATGMPSPIVIGGSATKGAQGTWDVIVTDPPYYDAIPYSDLMDFFYVWLRRTLGGLKPSIDEAFRGPLGPKWSHAENDGELIDDASRFGGDGLKSKKAYEDGVLRAFQSCAAGLAPEGRMIVVFANKHPDAWETLASAIIRAGFAVDGSWPIQTEREARVRAYASAALSSSVWLVCKKRPESARPGWDNQVLEEMRQKITARLRDFWDAGIRGPDFVWAATGPALEAYSKHPVVKKANEPGALMTVSEFLRHVRRIVVDFVVGRVLSHNGGPQAATGLDDVTTYYLLHRHDFGLEEAPAGACILYAVSCGLSDNALVDQYDVLIRTGGRDISEEDEDQTSEDGSDDGAAEGSGSKVKLKQWYQRKRPSMGYDSGLSKPSQRISPLMSPMFPDLEQPAVSPREVPLIDQVHRLLHLWRAGDVTDVNEYLDLRGLRRNVLFHHLLQALIELSAAGSEERSLLESISNYLAARGEAPRTLFD